MTDLATKLRERADVYEPLVGAGYNGGTRPGAARWYRMLRSYEKSKTSVGGKLWVHRNTVAAVAVNLAREYEYRLEGPWECVSGSRRTHVVCSSYCFAMDVQRSRPVGDVRKLAERISSVLCDDGDPEPEGNSLWQRCIGDGYIHLDETARPVNSPCFVCGDRVIWKDKAKPKPPQPRPKVPIARPEWDTARYTLVTPQEAALDEWERAQNDATAKLKRILAALAKR